MIFTTLKTIGHRASILKSMIGLALCAIPVVAGSNGIVARGDEVQAGTLCTTSSISVPVVTAISSTESSCTGGSVTVTVTVTTLNSDDPMQTAGPPLSGSLSSGDNMVGTVTETVTSTGTITETATDSTSTDVETTTTSDHGYVPFIGSISSIPEQPSTVNTISSTNTATKTLTDTVSLSANSTVYVSTTVTVATVTVSGTAGTIGTILPSLGHGNGNSTFTYSVPSTSVYPSSGSANNGGGRGAQVWYCIVMVVAVLGYAL
ncbi:uncharacterized protein QC763_708540 [Podospora pseudopauciseta]|uniref:Uncharacterized protein n=1 Tax=Podospora pseudopauciseta TaxID=2093780 RepID=A0ABR0H1N3_9PEZI|nr:hypothetical protein QC763_708540 [Podospora pseudopauciseta]